MLKQQNLYHLIIIIIVSVENIKEINGYRLKSPPYNELKRFKRQSGCNETQFLCDNGQFISIHKVCDGISDCSNGSDEKLNCNINGTRCPNFKFQCAYGACIDVELKCNGAQDCWDDSDEDAKICSNITTTTKSLNSDGECPPLVIENSKYEVLGNLQYVPGDPIPNYSIVEVTCINNYVLTTSNDKIICLNGHYQNESPKCVLLCPSRFSVSLDVKCEFNGVDINCSEKVPEGTIATMNCKRHYRYKPPAPIIEIAICSNGSWDVPLKQCLLECGELVPTVQPQIVGGQPAKQSEFPWHVAIYRQASGKPHSYKCGGSIIGTKIVLSAAHCFTEPKSGKLFPITEFSVAAGKYFSDWDAPEDEDFVQKRKVSKIEIPNDIFIGSQSSFAGDIAVVIVGKPFEFIDLITPVCVDWNYEYVGQHLKNGTLGDIAGWGWGAPKTKNLPETFDLQQLRAPFIDREQCLDMVPQDFRTFVTTDKYCAGYTNGSRVCTGDDGGGMVFSRRNNRGINKYYIQGIVSLVPQKDFSCSDNQIGIYTKVSSHIQFIKKIEVSNREN